MEMYTGYTGIAPSATVINLKVLDNEGSGFLSDVIEAIDWAVANRDEYNIRVINLSIAVAPVESYRDDPLCQAVAQATEAGIVAVTAAGNFGVDESGQVVYGGITSPGTSPQAITVGAVDTRWTDERSDDLVTPYSSRGPARWRSVDPETGAVLFEDYAKPDLVAPGHDLASLMAHDNFLVQNYPWLKTNKKANRFSNAKYMYLSGSSISAGVVSGAAALMLHANPSLTPNMVKAILMYTAQIMEGPDMFEQGAGLLNIEGAVRLAQALSLDAGALEPGDVLLAGEFPDVESLIAGETVVWSQSLIWGGGRLRGRGLFRNSHLAYASSLIWGNRRNLRAWGASVEWQDGMFSDDYVVFGGNDDWLYLAATGVVWQNRTIIDDFYSVEPTSLIWGGYRSRRLRTGSLIWGGSRRCFGWRCR